MSDQYRLSAGSHEDPADGRCAMEWIAYLAGEPHTDDPKCVDPKLRQVLMGLNDSLDDVNRQRLRPYLARAIGTANDGLHAYRRAVLQAPQPCSCMVCNAHRHRVGTPQALLDYYFKPGGLLDRLLPLIPVKIPEVEGWSGPTDEEHTEMVFRAVQAGLLPSSPSVSEYLASWKTAA